MKRVLSVLLLLITLALSMPLVAADVNWGSVQSQKVKLFYPGVASWEFVNSNNHGVGRVPVSKRKKACPECHIDKEGNLDVKAAEIVNGSLSMKASKKVFEPNPVEGKPGFLDADPQAAYDNENIYLRLQWSSAGKSWTGGDSGVPDRVAIQLNSGQDEFSKYGCFVYITNGDHGANNFPHSQTNSFFPITFSIQTPVQQVSQLQNSPVLSSHGRAILPFDRPPPL